MSIRITGSASGLDTDSMVQELVHAYEKKGQSYTKKKTKNEWKQEAWNDLNKKIKSFYSKYAGNMRFSQNYNKKITTVSDSTKASVVSSDGAVNGTQTLKVKSLAMSGYLTGANLGKGITSSTTLKDLGYEGGATTITINQGQSDETHEFTGTKSFDIDSTTTVGEFVKFLSSAGYNANFDAGNSRVFMSSKESGADNDFSFAAEAGSDAYKALSAIGLVGGDSVKQVAADASIELNGANFTSSTNTFSINGLTITAKEVTGDATVNLVTDTDNQAVYDSIKGFLKEYNSLINEFDKLYNAGSSKGYEPLTDEEKEAMTDKEIEKWESKIKDSLLRFDDDLDKISSAMRNAMLKTYDIGGKTMSLSSFGINTLGYFEAPDNEKNAFHIDGDSDDDSTSGNIDKLMTALAADPNGTAEFFQKLAGGLYDAMNNIQGSSDNYTSFGSFFSDKKLKSEYTDLNSQVEKWEDYVADIEEKYYKQFAAMESALSSLQSQQSYLSNLFG